MPRRITLVSVDAGGGHNCGLAIGLKKYGDLTVVWGGKNPHGLDYFVPEAKYGYGNIPKKGDDLIIVACITYDRLKERGGLYKLFSQYHRVHVIVTDGRFARNPNHYNKEFDKFNIDVITNACKRHFREPLPTRTYYQPFDLSHIDQTKWKRLTIAHSPFGPGKFKEKGTELIIETLKAWGSHNLDVITGVSWDECLKRKGKAHIFIDQVNHYDRDKFKFKSKDYVWPALGKSGLEAMHLGCLVITYGKGYDTDIPAPPLAWCTTETFPEVLEYYLKHPKEREELAEKGKEWALKYASYDFAAQNVLK